MKNSFYFISISSLFLVSCSTPDSKMINKAENDSTVYHMLNKHQVLLTNSAEFKDHSGLNGASSFLIEYNNKTYVATAKHLLGEAGGVEPEIKPNELHNYLLNWKLFPRVPINESSDTVLIGKDIINYSKLEKDILILPVANRKHDILVLNPNFQMPKENDQVFIIGCPYSEEDCKQNIYEGKFSFYDTETGLLVIVLKNKIELPGFSGAPLVDAKGNAIGVVTCGWEENGVYNVGATFIKEIQKVK